MTKVLRRWWWCQGDDLLHHLESWKASTEAQIFEITNTVQETIAGMKSMLFPPHKHKLKSSPSTPCARSELKEPILQEVVDLKAENRLFFQEMLRVQSKYEELMSQFRGLLKAAQKGSKSSHSDTSYAHDRANAQSQSARETYWKDGFQRSKNALSHELETLKHAPRSVGESGDGDDEMKSTSFRFRTNTLEELLAPKQLRKSGHISSQ